MSIGERLKDERSRLGLNQDEFAQLAGVQRRAQVRYEQDERAPDAAYLAAIATGGVDVLYVLTGQRSVGVLAPDESALLDNYRHSSEDQQHILKATSAAFAQPQKGRKAAS